MFTVNGNPIMEDELTILEELRRQCLLNGLDLFRIFRPSGDDIMTNCPFHKGGQERKPSFGVSKTDMKCHCFACGWAGTVDQMISEVFGYSDDNGEFGRRWLSKNFLTVSVESRKPLQLNMTRGGRGVSAPVSTGFTEEELDKYRYYHPYMYQRGLTDEIIEKFDIGFDIDSQCITFPVYHIDSSPAFVARRSVKSKFFNYPEGVEKPVYCAERFVSGQYPEAIICESFFNALTCWKHGRPAMALIGTGTEYQYEILRNLPVRKYILALDPDNAGRRAMSKLKQALQSTKIITFLDVPEGKDINDCDAMFEQLGEYF